MIDLVRVIRRTSPREGHGLIAVALLFMLPLLDKPSARPLGALHQDIVGFVQTSGRRAAFYCSWIVEVRSRLKIDLEF